MDLSKFNEVCKRLPVDNGFGVAPMAVARNVAMEQALYAICSALNCDVLGGKPREGCGCHQCAWYRVGARALGVLP